MIVYNKLHENLNSWRTSIFLHSDAKASFLPVKGSRDLAISNNTLTYNYPGHYL